MGLWAMFVCVASATTINLDWFVDGNTYAQTTCESGGNLNIPSTTPTKRGYHFIGWEKSNYIQLDYIESTGTQYIDTGVGYTTNTILEVEFQKLQTVGIGNNLFGTGSEFSSSDDFSLWCTADSGLAIHLPYPKVDSKRQLSDESIIDKAYLKVNLATRTILLNDSSYVVDNKTTTSGSNIPITLFTAPFTSQYVSNFIGRVFSFKLYNNGILVCNLIPAKRISDNAIGMYDTVTRTFFTNQGTGDFIAGPVSANQTLE